MDAQKKKKLVIGVLLVTAVLRLGASGFRLAHDFSSTGVSGAKLAKAAQDMTSVMSQLGTDMQLGRECGISEARMTGHQAFHDLVLNLLNGKLGKVPAEKIKLLGTSDDVARTFQQAEAKIQALSPQEIAARCPETVKDWDTGDALLLKQAQDTSAKFQ
jgi:hypothetical protein